MIVEFSYLETMAQKCWKEINKDGFLSWESLCKRIPGLSYRDLLKLVVRGDLCILSNHCFDIPARRDKRAYEFRHKLLVFCDVCNKFTFKNEGRCQFCGNEKFDTCIFPMLPIGEYR